MPDKKDKALMNDDVLAVNHNWLKRRYLDLREREEQIGRLLEECKQIRREIELMEEWLAAMEGKSIDWEGAGEQRLDASIVTGSEKEQGVEVRGDRLRDEVVKILTEVYPDEMYYQEILVQLRSRGYQVAGKNPGLNIIGHLAKEPRVVRGEKRGMYCLEETYANTGEIRKNPDEDTNK